MSEHQPHREKTFCNLSGQIAMVTGGATGIGAATVRRLSSLGACVVCCYCKNGRQAELLAKELNQASEKVLPVQVDVTDSHHIESAVNTLEKHFGRSVSILINNAGGISDPTEIGEMSETMWNAEMDLNLTSAFLCSKFCIAGMKANRYGRIINNSSLAAQAGGGPGHVSYATSKGGMEAFTRGLAKELGPFGITVNAVAPGVIDTAIHQRSNTAGDMEEIKQRTPLRRLGHPDDVAATIAFLACEEASYITGETIAINGGLRVG